MKLIDIMDEFDTCIEEMEAEEFEEDVAQYIIKLRDLSAELLDFYKEHKGVLHRRSYDPN